MKQVRVILLQHVSKLGRIGDIVNVKPGFARNYLLPQRIALRANKANLEYFEHKKSEIEAMNAKARSEAEVASKGMDGLVIKLVRSASENGHLYGSVTARDVAKEITDKGFEVNASHVIMDSAIKQVGEYQIAVSLHPEVNTAVKLVIAKNEEELSLIEEGQI